MFLCSSQNSMLPFIFSCISHRFSAALMVTICTTKFNIQTSPIYSHILFMYSIIFSEPTSFTFLSNVKKFVVVIAFRRVLCEVGADLLNNGWIPGFKVFDGNLYNFLRNNRDHSRLTAPSSRAFIVSPIRDNSLINTILTTHYTSYLCAGSLRSHPEPQRQIISRIASCMKPSPDAQRLTPVYITFRDI